MFGAQVGYRFHIQDIDGKIRGTWTSPDYKSVRSITADTVAEFDKICDGIDAAQAKPTRIVVDPKDFWKDDPGLSSTKNPVVFTPLGYLPQGININMAGDDTDNRYAQDGYVDWGGGWGVPAKKPKPKCECGLEKTYGEGVIPDSDHSVWCAVYVDWKKNAKNGV